MVKNLSLISLVILFVSCQSLKTRRDVTPSTNASATASEVKKNDVQSTVVDSTVPAEEVVPQAVEIKPLPQISKSVPRFGIIFSGGGALTWGHVGVLKEFQKYKFPVVSVAGLEWGAVTAAIYGENLSSNEVEWEMSKFKNIDDWESFIKNVFEKKTVAQMKTSFVCPSLNLKSQTLYLLNRGNLVQFLPFCVPSFGLVKPYGDSVAGLTAVQQVAQHLRANGAQKIILINVLGPKANTKSIAKSVLTAENQLWVDAKVALQQKPVVYDELIELNLNDYSIDDFDRRREIIQKSADLSYSLIKKMADKYGL